MRHAPPGARVAILARQTGSSTVTTTYTYDALNRLKGVDYSDSTPDVAYSYDQSSYNGLTITNGKTRRTGTSDGSGTTAWSYDSVGNIVEEKRTLNSVTKSITYTYNKDSSLASMTYPNGRTVTYTTKGAQRPTKAEDTTNNITYATTALYAAHGGLSSLTNGASNIVLSTLYYNKRLQPCRIAINSSGTAPNSCDDNSNTGNVMDLKYDFGLGVSNNGNVLGITNKITSTRSQTFTYDALNRIATAAASTYAQSSTYCWGESFTIDAYGNLTGISNLSSAYNGCTNTENFSVTVSNSTNRISTSGYCYDSAGNLLGQSNCTTYEYNAENQLVATAGVTYTYDGDGKRVKKDQTSGSTYDRLYWYGLGLDVLAESDLSGNLTEEYVFFAGLRVARRNVSSGNIFYYFADHLGTSRTIVQAGQTVCYDADFYPYGGERAYINTCPQNYKFTGKEREGESNLDYFGARHYPSWMGRFLSPDLPFADQHMADPQSWNLYSYVRNNPLNLIDPDGRRWWTKCKWVKYGSDEERDREHLECEDIWIEETNWLPGDPNGQHEQKQLKRAEPTPTTPCRIVDPFLGALETTVKLGPEIQVGPIAVGGSIYKNMTTGETGGKLDFNVGAVGAEYNRPTPPGGSITGSSPNSEFSVHAVGFNKNLSTGERTAFKPSKSWHLGLQVLLGFELSFNAATFDKISRENQACRATGGK